MTDGELRKKFQEFIPQFHWQSVETWSTGQGVPDCNFCGFGKEGWIEFKKTETMRVTVSPEQVAWMERRMRNGGRCFVAVRRRHSGGARKGDAVDELWLFDGQAIRILKNEPLVAVPLNFLLKKTSGGPTEWDWPKVCELLLRQ